MNREALKELGLTDEQIEKVMTAHGSVVNATKDKLDTVTTDRDGLKDQLTDRDKQLDSLSKVDVEGLKAEIDKLKDDNATSNAEYQVKLDKQAFGFALDKAIVATGARNPKAVKALLDMETVKLDGEKLLGLDTQIETLKSSDDYLFRGDEKPGLKGRQPHETKTPPQGAVNPFSKATLNLTEQGRLLRDDPTLAKQLQAQA